MDEDDIGTYTAKALDDPRTLNKTLYLRPPENILSQRQLVEKWEKLSGKILEKVEVSAEEFLASMEGMDYAQQAGMGHFYHIFFEGCLTNFGIGEEGEEAFDLYPECKKVLGIRVSSPMRSPLAPLDYEIPEKVWKGSDVSYSYLRVFGCKVFAHLPKKRRSKLDEKSTPSIFVGNGDAGFGYMLWDPKQKKFFKTRDVVFQENQNLVDLEKQTQPKNLRALDLAPVPSSSPDAIDREEVNAPEIDILGTDGVEVKPALEGLD
ncbi:hypothetical protein RJ639_030423 [Escallonia herrerae]|uniref:Uncharacterized protein n=1 Tax=Escallonia herrerae TaxID=1293975 RepID=A0AA88X0Y8_9ASTE|nr:hypothetical protein RJ639_030423 [Escallonia herrerae]